MEDINFWLQKCHRNLKLYKRVYFLPNKLTELFGGGKGVLLFFFNKETDSCQHEGKRTPSYRERRSLHDTILLKSNMVI